MAHFRLQTIAPDRHGEHWALVAAWRISGIGGRSSVARSFSSPEIEPFEAGIGRKTPLIAAAAGFRLSDMAATTAGTASDDEQLAALVARREDSGPSLRAAREAFEQLYARHARALLAFLAARTRRGDLDDLNQEVWRRAWHHLPEQFRGGNFRAWLHQIARNAVIDHARKRRPELLEDEQRVPDGRLGHADAGLIEREQAEALRRCLGQLSAESAEMVRARLGGDPYEAICSRLGLSPGRAHKMFHRAKEQLQTCLERALA